MDEYFNVFGDVWGLLKKYRESAKSDNEELWDEIIKAADEIYMKHETELASKLIVVVLSELERINKAAKE